MKNRSSSTKFWDRIADRYARDPIKDEVSYNTKLEITRRYVRPEDRVLEFGCGTGATAILHAPFVNEIDATDLSPRMIEIARQRATDANIRNVHFSVASFESFEAPEQCYDVVLCLSLLHLIEDREAALAKVWRLLKPGGVFVSSTACIADMSRMLKYALPVGRLFGFVPHVAAFTGAQLRADIAKTGFQIVEDWRPAPDKALFLIARKAGSPRREL